MNAVIPVIATERNTWRTGSQLTFAYAAEASMLGLPPGRWPERIETTLGNRQPFVRERIERTADNEIACAVYCQHLGCTSLKVLND
jgi:hypothetical protein